MSNKLPKIILFILFVIYVILSFKDCHGFEHTTTEPDLIITERYILKEDEIKEVLIQYLKSKQVKFKNEDKVEIYMNDCIPTFGTSCEESIIIYESSKKECK